MVSDKSVSPVLLSAHNREKASFPNENEKREHRLAAIRFLFFIGKKGRGRDGQQKSFAGETEAHGLERKKMF